MKCSRCGGDMEARTVRFCICAVSPPVMILNVPAQVCRRCGGEVFSDSTIEAFERIRDGRIPARTGIMHVFDFAQAVQPLPTNGNHETRVKDPGTNVIAGFGVAYQDHWRGAPLRVGSGGTHATYR